MAGLTFGQANAADSSAEARIDWAKRRVELVCRPLEAQHLSAQAAKCYEEVSLFIADPKRAIPSEVETTPLRKIATESASPKKVAPPKAIAAKSIEPKAVATKATEPKTIAAKSAEPKTVAEKPLEPKAVAAAPSESKAAEQETAPVAKPLPVRRIVETKPVEAKHSEKTAESKAVDAKTEPKRPARRIVRVASIRHPAKPRVAARPVVIASNDRISNAMTAVQESVAVRRCGSLPCSRFTTMLGVGF